MDVLFLIEQTKSNQMAHFMKNTAMAGGALVLSTPITSFRARQVCRSPIRSSVVADPSSQRCPKRELQARFATLGA